MPLQSAPYYWLTCDGCGVSAQETSEYGAWKEVSTAIDEAEGSDWQVRAEAHGDDEPLVVALCPTCSRGMTCPECGEAKGTRDAACSACASDVEVAP